MEEHTEPSPSSDGGGDDGVAGKRSRAGSSGGDGLFAAEAPEISDTEQVDEVPEGRGDVKRSKRRRISLEQLRAQFNKPLAEAAEALDIGVSTLKRLCREKRIAKWPHREWCSINAAISNLSDREEKASEHKGEADPPLLRETKMSKEEANFELVWLLQRRQALMNLGVDTSRKTVTHKRRHLPPAQEPTPKREVHIAREEESAESPVKPVSPVRPRKAPVVPPHPDTVIPPPLFPLSHMRQSIGVPPPPVGNPYWDAVRRLYPDPFLISHDLYAHPPRQTHVALDAAAHPSLEPYPYPHLMSSQPAMAVSSAYYHPSFYCYRRPDLSHIYGSAYHSR